MCRCCISIACLINLMSGEARTGELNCINVCCVGHWSLESVCTVTYDKMRNLLFLGSGACVYILDVSNPVQPVKIGEFKHSTRYTCGLFYESNTHRLYICAGDAGLKIWNIADPSRPVEAGHYDTPGHACAVHVAGFYAYVADGDAGLRVIDVFDPIQPQEVGHYSITSACCIYISDSFAYVGDLGLRIVDISTPTEPQEIAYLDIPGVTFGVHVAGPYAYMASDVHGLRIIDVSTPTNAHEVGYYTTPGYAWDVCVSGSHAYVAACDAGLRIVDVSIPSLPKEVSYHATPDQALKVCVTDSLVYVADAASGLQIYSHVPIGR